MNTHTGHRLFSIRTIAVAITIAVFAAMLPQTAAAQRTSLNSLAAGQDDILCSLPSAPASCFTNRVVFVTSTVHTGDFGGVVGGDMICNSHAQAAGLPGRYRAWLSDSSGSPSTRFTQSPDPYVRTFDGATIANDWGDLVAGSLLNPQAGDETGGNLIFNGQYWTGTDSDGTPIGGSCSDWKSDLAIFNGPQGTIGAIDQTWTRLGETSCANRRHLLCFQQ